MTDEIDYNVKWVENELKYMKPHEYVKRYKNVCLKHTWGALVFLLWMLAGELRHEKHHEYEERFKKLWYELNQKSAYDFSVIGMILWTLAEELSEIVEKNKEEE